MTVGEGQTGGLGARYDAVFFSNSPENVSNAQIRVDESLGGWGNYQATLDAGLCPNEMAQSHELVHVFVAGTPIGIGYCAEGKAICLALNEGLAEYMRYQVNDGETQPGVYSSVHCEAHGYRTSWNAEDLVTYADFGNPDDGSTSLQRYQTGLCLWDYIETTYGHDAFLDIMADLNGARDRTGPRSNCPLPTGGSRPCMGNILDEFIVPNTDTAILDVFAERFGLLPGHTNYLIPRWLEWSRFY